MPRALPRYACPYSSKQEVFSDSNNYRESDSKNEITDDKCIEAGRGLLSGERERHNLRIVYRWKLQAFRKRLARIDRFPDDLSDEEISYALVPARALKDNFLDANKIGHAVRVFDGLPGVGVPVASAFLMAMHPKQFTVIDRQAYKSLSATFHEPISVVEYIAYLNFCRSRAQSLDVSLRQYDQALWQSGSEIR